MRILGIETSCDETSAAIVDADRQILAHQLLSQKEHADFGGVVPEVAARAHLDHLDDLIRAALAQAGLDFADLEALAVTAGPGLIGGLLVGVTTAKAIARVHDLPLVAVNHLEGHALTVRLTHGVAFPYLLLLVSGGHCQLLEVSGVGRYRKLGGTLDDAVGEAFDKTAKILGLGYPGGPAVEKLARTCLDPHAAAKDFPLPRALCGKPGCDFSFSGLKTAVRNMAQKYPDQKAAIAASFQVAAADALCDRTRHALDLAPLCKQLVVAGGVASNQYLRGRLQELCDQAGISFIAPPPALCSDNAAMIAWAGLERFRLGLVDDLTFTPRPRWPLEELQGRQT